MEDRRIDKTTTVANTKENNNSVHVLQAQRKRMLLSEVYVHKARKVVNSDPSQVVNGDDDNFGVYHIFEFADDSTTKIIPKLSTNCTEPRKIIDVLQNSTGSDTPQLQRLIEKLCAQNRKWMENQQNQQKNVAAAPAAPAAAAAVPGNTLFLDGRDHTYNKKYGPQPAVSTASTSTVSVRLANGNVVAPVLRPTKSPSVLVGNLRPSQVTVDTTRSKQMERTDPTSKQPVIRVKALESLTDASQTASQPSSDDRPRQQHAFAKKSVTIRPVVRSPNGVLRVKVPNSLMQQQQQQQKNNQATRLSNNASTTTAVVTAVSTPSAVVSNKLSTVKQTQPNLAVQQPVRLWNNMMSTSVPEPLKVHVSVKTRIQGNDNHATFPMQSISENATENAKDNASTLKIGQIFEGVSGVFVEDSFDEDDESSAVTTEAMEQIQQPVQSPSPLLDTLVKEIKHDVTNIHNGKSTTTTTAILNDGDNPKLVTIVQNDDKSCDDYRCNICLTFNNSILEYRTHMLCKHGFKVICEKCHDAFNHQQAFLNHVKFDSGSGDTMKCSLSANANRAYICIVEPPTILMRNKKVFAFRCKYCDLAFQNQKNYVQHAQRHAKLFRCKKCPTKPLSMDLMREHLTHHKN